MKNIRIWTLITAEMLQSKKACQPQIEIFKSEWPSGVKITKRNLLRAAEIGLDINWFSDEFLSTTAWEAYQKAMAPAYETCKKAKAAAREVYAKATAPALEVCEKVEAPAREVYEKAMATAWEAFTTLEAYQKAKAAAREVYAKATAPAWEVYEKVKAPAREVYEKAMATAWEVYEKAVATALYNVIKYK